MRKTNLLSFLLVYFLTQSAVHGQTLTSAIYGNSELILTYTEIKNDEILALDGSAQSSRKLFEYYEFVTHDQKNAVKWAIIAAENSGTADDYYDAGVVMSLSDDSQIRRRAIFWLNKAKASGNISAQRLIDKLSAEFHK